MRPGALAMTCNWYAVRQYKYILTESIALVKATTTCPTVLRSRFYCRWRIAHNQSWCRTVYFLFDDRELLGDLTALFAFDSPHMQTAGA